VPSPAEIAAVLVQAAVLTGPWAPLILFLAAFIEHVFPPFPGDLLVVLGAWYATHGQLSWVEVLACTTGGSVAGAAVDHRIGVLLGRALEGRAARSRMLPPERLAAFEAAYRRWGAWLVLGNRFLPGVRAFIFVAAGASRLPLHRVLLLGGLSALIWNGLLLGAGALVAHNAEELIALVGRSMTSLAVVAALVAAGLVVRAALRGRSAR
jgi:membrane protein DedA with SNARE-associated domain